MKAFDRDDQLPGPSWLEALHQEIADDEDLAATLPSAEEVTGEIGEVRDCLRLLELARRGFGSCPLAAQADRAL